MLERVFCSDALEADNGDLGTVRSVDPTEQVL
jgi:hypothetical protein